MRILAAYLVCLLAVEAADLPKAVDAAMWDEMKRQELVGRAVGVIVDGRVVYTQGYGWADREKQVPVTRATMFRWASISKSLTAVAAMQLWERKQLELTTDVRRLVPEFPAKVAQITLRHLLCHQGGIVHYTNGKVVVTVRRYEQPNPFENVLMALDTFKHSPVVNAPGEKFAYTTHGYILLSAAVERAGKQKFADQVRDRIAKPLGMKSLQPDYQWRDIPHRAVGYRKRDGEIVPSTNTDVSWKLGGGGYISNIDDLAKFALGLLHHNLVQKGTAAKMWTPQKLNNGKFTSYGLGFSIAQYHEGKLGKWQPAKLKHPGPTPITLVGHGGSQEKTRTRLLIIPGQNVGVVVMTNSENGDSTKLAGRLLKVLLAQR